LTELILPLINSTKAVFKSGLILQDRYQLQHPLGRSAAGRQTWLATDLSIEPPESIIVKLLMFSEMQWQDLRLFEREAQVLQNLDYSKIPRYRDYFLVNQTTRSTLCWWGLVQDYVQGTSLQELLEQGKRFSQQDVHRIAEEVLQILMYLHKLCPPVLHRDIKPSNLILDQAQQIWLVDFGAVQDQAALTGISFTVVGTVGYAPLEQFWGRAVAASDLYALGATLIHLLTGTAPVDLPQHNLKIQFSDRATINPGFVSWIEKLVEPALECRFTSADEAYEALNQPQNSLLGRIQTLHPNSTKKVQRVNPRIVVTENTKDTLKIEFRGYRHPSSLFCFSVYFVVTLLGTFLFNSLGGWGFILSQIVFCIFAVFDLRSPKFNQLSCLGSIWLDASNDCFAVRNKSKSEVGRISDIQYLSIIPTEVTHYTSSTAISYTQFWVNIRTKRTYMLKWQATEGEFIWLVNEIQNWLNATK
jgi:serine/threonine protein kinase